MLLYDKNFPYLTQVTVYSNAVETNLQVLVIYHDNAMTWSIVYSQASFSKSGGLF